MGHGQTLLGTNLKTHRLTRSKSAPTAAVGDLGLGKFFRTHISIIKKTSEIFMLLGLGDTGNK